MAFFQRYTNSVTRLSFYKTCVKCFSDTGQINSGFIDNRKELLLSGDALFFLFCSFAVVLRSHLSFVEKQRHETEDFLFSNAVLFTLHSYFTPPSNKELDSTVSQHVLSCIYIIIFLV